MNESPTNHPPTPGDSAPGAAAGRSPVLAIVHWLVVVAVIFAAVAVGMSFLSLALNTPTVAVASPGVETALAEADTGLPAPDFRLTSLDGDELGPPDYAGDVVLVEFWATWCGPCRLQARFIEELHRDFADQGVRFLAVNVGEDREMVEKYVAKTPFPYPVLLDPKDTMTPRYRLLGLPTVMIIDRQGGISFLNTGLSSIDQLRRELAAAGVEV